MDAFNAAELWIHVLQQGGYGCGAEGDYGIIMNTKYWICWWWVRGGMHDTPWIRTMYCSRKLTNKYLQTYDIENGWKVGRVHRIQVEMGAPPPK